MDSFIEGVLASAIKTANPETHFTSAALILDDLSTPRHKIMDAVYYLVQKGYLTNGADGYMIGITPTGLQYFSNKKRKARENFKNNFTFPLLSSLISGSIGAIIGALITYFIMK